METDAEKPIDVWICLDFEATCDEGDPPQVRRDQAEMIEFSFVIYDGLSDSIAFSSQHYCKNTKTPLTQFCTQLTGITAETLAVAGTLEDAMAALQSALQTFAGRSTCVVAHGSWDLEYLLPANCQALGLDTPPVLQKYVDLRSTAQMYLQRKSSSRRASTLTEICAALGVKMEGRLHSGLDDAKLIALAFGELLRAGATLVPVDLRLERKTFCSKEEQLLCLDGLPFTAVAPELLSWLREIGYSVKDDCMQMLLNADGRPSGLGIVDFGTHAAAADALSSFGVGRQLWQGTSERLVILRPIRAFERLAINHSGGNSGARVISFPVDAATIGNLRSGVARKHGHATTMGESDWVCPTCLQTVCARDAACRKCGVQKPSRDTIPVGVSAMMGAKPGDWNCPQCQDLVFARNSACRRCGTQKPGHRKSRKAASEAGSSGYAPNAKPGDWMCPNCNDLVFARNSACRKCGTTKASNV